MQASNPPLGLNEALLQTYRQQFDLSYHINYLEICRQEIPLQGLDVLEVGGALPASLVLDHLQCNSWTCVEAPSYDEELGTANQIHRNEADPAQEHKARGRYRHLYLNMEDMPSEHYNQYDLIFSIACFEHIARLPLALEIMHRCLRPGGKLFTMHSPIWSAYDGHHLPVKIPARFETTNPEHKYIFRPWGHLLQTRSQSYQDLCYRFDREFAEEVVYYTYNSGHINRYFSEDYATVFAQSPFLVSTFQLTFQNRPSAQIQQALESRLPGYKQFSNNGILAVARKEPAERPLLIL